MLIHWRLSPFKNPIINRAWTLTLGLLVWNLWKIHNRYIFKDQSTPSRLIWKTIKDSIRDTILSKSWVEDDWWLVLEEANILANLNLSPYLYSPWHPIQSQPQAPPPLFYSHPLEGFIKIKFYGASKGNISSVGYGGILRNWLVQMLSFFLWPYGHTTNNVLELIVLKIFLIISKPNHFRRIQITEDSKMVIRMALKFLHGVLVENILKS